MRTGPNVIGRGARANALLIVGLVLAVLIAGCAPADRSSADRNASPASQPAAPKRITAAMMGNPPTVVQRTIGGIVGNIPGITQLEQILSPEQRSAILAAAPRTGLPQRPTAPQSVYSRTAALDAFVGRVLLTSSAVEVLAAEWMQAQAASDPGADPRGDLSGARP